MTSVLSIADRRRTALIQMWVRDSFSVQVQVESSAQLLGIAHNISGAADARLARVGTHRERSVIMLQAGPNRDTQWSVWVRAGFSNYKRAYLAFVSMAYGLHLTGDDIPGYEVDHLSNKAYAPSGDEYIRLEAIPQPANHSWGVNFERARTTNTYARPMHTLSYMSCAKLGGQLAPVGEKDVAAIQRLIAYFTSIGLDANDAADGVRNMMRHAYWSR